MANPKNKPTWQAGTTHYSGRQSQSRGNCHRIEAEEAWLNGLKDRINDVFTIGHFVGYYNCIDLVLVLYLYLVCDCLYYFRMDDVSFFMETHVNDLNAYDFLGEFVIPHCPHGASSIKIVPLEDSKIKGDRLLNKMLGEVESVNLEGGDQLAPKGGHRLTIILFVLF